MQGDNLVTAILTGPGIVFIQSLPFHRLSQRIARYFKQPIILTLFRLVIYIYVDKAIASVLQGCYIPKHEGESEIFYSDSHLLLLGLCCDSIILDLDWCMILFSFLFFFGFSFWSSPLPVQGLSVIPVNNAFGVLIWKWCCFFISIAQRSKQDRLVNFVFVVLMLTFEIILLKLVRHWN